jgi:RNA polymerase sigma factor (TIGR02999 family)
VATARCNCRQFRQQAAKGDSTTDFFGGVVAGIVTNCAPIDPGAAVQSSSPSRGSTEPASMSVDDISQLLRAWSDGDQLALRDLTPVVYAELRRLAHRYMRGERSNHSLQTSALVNEAYIRLVDYKRMQWQNRAHFFAVSAQLMRRILVEHARRHNLKRGRGVQHVSFDEAVVVSADPRLDLVALDDALKALARVDPRKVQVVEMRFFGGLSVEETATVLKVSPVTVRRDWSSAKIWLYRELTGETDDGLGSLETAR